MKYLIVIADGSADDPVHSLGGRTPLEVANLETIDMLASRGEIGTVITIPDGIKPGSDSGNLSIMGYDPRKYLSGRSPLETVAIGVEMNDTDVAFRANLATVDPAGAENYEDYIILDHGASDITTEESDLLLQVINEKFANEKLRFYTGTGYRHCMLIHEGHPNAHTDYECMPPHDVPGQRVGDNLPKGENADFIIDMMKESYKLLKDHPVNKAREARGLHPGNTLWIWGQGKRPDLPDFYEKYGVKASVISAVDLIRGIGTFAGMHIVSVPGATGTIDTDYEAKVAYAIEEFKRGQDMVYLHIEGTDETSHQGNVEAKIRCAQYIDQRVVKPLYAYLRDSGEEFRILVLPDHRTTVEGRIHTSDFVPFVLYDSNNEAPVDTGRKFTEKSAEAAHNHFPDGYKLADKFFERK